MNVDKALSGFSLTFGRTSLLACSFKPDMRWSKLSSSPPAGDDEAWAAFSLIAEEDEVEVEETTASFAEPVTTAANLSVSNEDGPLKADQNDEASLPVMCAAAAPASVASAVWAVGDGVDVDDLDSTKNFGRRS